MNFLEAIRSCLRQYLVFRGRAGRSEFWWFVVFMGLSVWLAEEVVSLGFSGLVMLALFPPYLAVSARRLHDVGHSGWWQLLMYVTGIAVLLMLYWYVQPSDQAENKWGLTPHPRQTSPENII